MKTVQQQILSGILIGLATSCFSLKAQSVPLTDADSTVRSFRVGAYVNADKHLMVLLGPGDSKRLHIKLKDPKLAIIYQAFLNGGPTTYRQKFNFEEAASGVYELEVSDGLQTVIRKVEVVDVPAVAPQRFLTYGSKSNF